MTKAGISKPVKLENFCKICHKTITGSSYKFKSHLFKHNAVTERYNCDFCLKKFYRKDSYKIHLNQHLGTVARKTYICDYCDRAFSLKNNLIIHLKRIHDENLDTDLGKFMCSICDISYCERRLLYQHIHKVHFNATPMTKVPLHINKLINETWIETVKNKTTSVSMTKVNSNVIVIKKLKVDVEVEEYKPNINNMQSKYLDQYSQGVCDYCKKDMLKKSLRTHIREVHMKIRKFECKVCKETFPRHYQMVNHKCGTFKRKSKIYRQIKNKEARADHDS